MDKHLNTLHPPPKKDRFKTGHICFRKLNFTITLVLIITLFHLRIHAEYNLYKYHMPKLDEDRSALMLL